MQSIRHSILGLLLFVCGHSFGQTNDTVPAVHVPRVDTTIVTADSAISKIDNADTGAKTDTLPPKISKKEQREMQRQRIDSLRTIFPHARRPGAAALRSAVLPGWGQVYNHRIWKVPLVYGALGVTGGIFVYNLTWYKRFRYAYKIAYQISKNGNPTAADSVGYDKVYPEIQRAFFGNRFSPEALRNNRDDIRKNVDYSAVFFIIAWALNIVDATVDAHLSTFDVSRDLSFKIKPGFSDMGNTAGLSFVLQFK